MKISIEPSPDSISEFEIALQQIRGRTEWAKNWAWAKAYEEYQKLTLEIFETYGDVIGVPWPPLSKYTVWERELLGFSMLPMMVRKGYLKKSVTDPFFEPGMYMEPTYDLPTATIGEEEIYSGHFVEELEQSEETEAYAAGSVDERFDKLWESRPFVPGEEGDELLGKRIDDVILAGLEGMQ